MDVSLGLFAVRRGNRTLWKAHPGIGRQVFWGRPCQQEQGRRHRLQ